MHKLIASEPILLNITSQEEINEMRILKSPTLSFQHNGNPNITSTAFPESRPWLHQTLHCTDYTKHTVLHHSDNTLSLPLSPLGNRESTVNLLYATDTKHDLVAGLHNWLSKKNHHIPPHIRIYNVVAPNMNVGYLWSTISTVFGAKKIVSATVQWI